MALTEENGLNATMLLSPTNGNVGGYGYPAMPMMPMMPFGQGNNGGMFGGNDSWLGILFLIALCNGGFGFGGGFGGGYGNMQLGYDFPWLLNGQNGINNNVSSGFRDAQLNDGITSIRDSISALANQICNCCGDMQLNMSNGFNSVNNTIFGAQTAIAQQMSANEMASLNRSFNEQMANQQGFNGVQAGISDLRYTTATEACATRNADAQNTRDIIDAVRGGNQMIMDKLCALELDGVKGQLAQAQRENVGLQNAVNMATTRAENIANADNIVNNLYNRLSTCPVGTTPVFGNQPIFTCAQNVAGSGCGCNGGF